jgi:trans-aconitate methyltransferase
MTTWNPKDYAQHSAAQLAWARELLDRLALRGDEAALDVGCGDGKITAECAARLPGGYALGIDAAPEMIAYARAAFPPQTHPNLEFFHLDARRIALERRIDLEARFDLAFSNAALHWIEDQPAVLVGIAHALKPGGRMAVSCGGRGNAAEILECLEAMLATEPWREMFCDFPPPYFFYGPREWAAWLREAGLTVERLELVPKDMTLAGREGLTGWVRTTWHPYTERVPEERREAFIDELAERYLARHPLDAEGLCHVAMVRLEAQARKA